MIDIKKIRAELLTSRFAMMFFGRKTESLEFFMGTAALAFVAGCALSGWHHYDGVAIALLTHTAFILYGILQLGTSLYYITNKLLWKLVPLLGMFVWAHVLYIDLNETNYTMSGNFGVYSTVILAQWWLVIRRWMS